MEEEKGSIELFQTLDAKVDDLKVDIRRLWGEIRKNNHLKEDVENNTKNITTLLERVSGVEASRQTSQSHKHYNQQERELKIDSKHLLVAGIALFLNVIVGVLGVIF